MNTKDKLQLLNNAIQQLMELYRVLDGELPQLYFAKSDLKKIAVTY